MNPKEQQAINALEKIVGKKLKRSQTSELSQNDTYSYYLNDEKKVVSLGLYDCNLTNIPIEIIKLTSLQNLWLSCNQIQKIENLEKLTSLRELLLSHNQIQKIENLEKLTSLQLLALDGNQIQKIENLEKLTSLQRLHLNTNQIPKIENLEKLTSLQNLWLGRNQIRKIENLEKLTSLEWLYLFDNQIKDFPEDILKSCDAQKILNYFKSLEEQGVKFLNEGKMLVLGHGRVGKTSLIKSLLFSATGDKKYKFSDEPETIGIVRQEYICDIERENEKQSKFTLSIWDFGGQEVQHSTHEHFIQEAIIIIVLDMTDKYNKDHPDGERTWKDDLGDWLKRVRQLANCKKENVFLVLSKAEAKEKVFTKNEVEQILEANNCGGFTCIEYSAKQVSSLIEGTLPSETDRKKAREQQNKLIQTITLYIKNSSFYPIKFPRGWFDLKNDIIEKIKEAEKGNIGYIPKSTFDKLCRNYIEKYKDQKTNTEDILRTIAENLSILSYFPRAERISAKIYRTDWITNYLYKLIGKYLFDTNRPSIFTFSKLSEIFQTQNDTNLTTEILDIFQALDLVIPDKNENWIVPEFLPESTYPPLDNWQKENLIFHGKWIYDWMPNSIFLRLMVKMANDPDIEVTPTSKNWFIADFNEKNAKALFTKGSIEIRMKGKDTEELKRILRHAESYLQEIHKKWKYNVEFNTIINKLSSNNPESRPEIRAGDTYIIRDSIVGQIGKRAHQDINFPNIPQSVEKKSWWEKIIKWIKTPIGIIITLIGLISGIIEILVYFQFIPQTFELKQLLKSIYNLLPIMVKNIR